MVIRATDRLEHVLGSDEEILDRFLAASPELAGLRNPTTRRVMGRLATVADIARMAGLEPDILIHRLNRALKQGTAAAETAGKGEAREGRRTPAPTEEKEAISTDSSDVPGFLSTLPPDRRIDLDVREDLRNGREPFSRIMAARARVPEGGVLRLRATFEPRPLYAVMAKQGYDHWTEELAPDDWRVWFHPRHLAEESDAANADVPVERLEPTTAQADAPSARDDADTAEQMVVIDVRGMEPPEPMVHTLAALETLPPGSTLLQINERVPQFLLPRLRGLGFEYEIHEQAEGVVRLFIRRPADAGDSDPLPGIESPASRQRRSTL